MSTPEYYNPEAYLEHCRTYVMELFVEIINSKLLTIFAKKKKNSS